MAIGITRDQILAAVKIAEPTAHPVDWIVDGVVDNWDVAIAKGAADNVLRVSHILAQMSVETGHWRTLIEYHDGSDYEGRADLGNTQPGDGKKHNGHYDIQLTGRANFEYYAAKTGIPIDVDPDKYAQPEHVREAMIVSVAYWDDPTSEMGAHQSINRFADSDHPVDVENVTRAVNGGTTGYDERLNYYRAFRQIFTDDTPHIEDSAEPVEPPLVELPVPLAQWQVWSTSRQNAALGQQYLADHECDVGAIDGLIGAQTQQALAQFEHLAGHGAHPPNWRDDDDDTRPPPPPPDASMKWPTQAEVSDFYGSRGSNQVLLKSPYELRLYEANGQPYSGFNIHEKCHDSCMRVLREVLDVYGYAEIVRLRLHVFSGCYNNRKMTGGSNWSMHAWAIAIDWNAPENQYSWDHQRALFAGPEYEAWRDAWAREGWIGLGPVRDYDWMHWQAARLS